MMRDKIADVRYMGTTIGHGAADAIMLTWPDMIEPLVWERGVVDWACLKQGGKYVACSTSPYGSWAWWLDGDDETREVHPSEEAAKAAANTHHRAAIMAAFGVAQ